MPRRAGIHTKQLTEAERQRCRTLREDTSWTYQQIADVTGYTLQQVFTACRAPSAKPRERPGRPPKMKPDEVETLIDFVRASQRGRRMRFYELAQELFDNAYGEYAIRWTLRQRGFGRYIARYKPPITEADRQKRLQWAQEHVGWSVEQWKRILWTDETWLTGAHHRRQWVTRQPGEEHDDTCIVERHQGKDGWMFWGCISGYGKGPGFFWEKDWGTVSAETFIERTVPIIDDHLTILRNQGYEVSLMQDGASDHRTQATAAELRRRGITVVTWPPCSPDLSPIDTVWNKMQNDIEEKYGLEKKPTYAALRGYVIEAWNAVPESYVQHLISQMPHRCQAVIDANGMHTKW